MEIWIQHKHKRGSSEHKPDDGSLQHKHAWAPHGYTSGYENGNGFFWSANNSVVNEIVSHNTIVVYLWFKSNYVFGLD